MNLAMTTNAAVTERNSAPDFAPDFALCQADHHHGNTRLPTHQRPLTTRLTPLIFRAMETHARKNC
jgi:hypothetical protein